LEGHIASVWIFVKVERTAVHPEDSWHSISRGAPFHSQENGLKGVEQTLGHITDGESSLTGLGLESSCEFDGNGVVGGIRLFRLTVSGSAGQESDFVIPTSLILLHLDPPPATDLRLGRG
jgi:predicted transcriptional regulator with HTH domain